MSRSSEFTGGNWPKRNRNPTNNPFASRQSHEPWRLTRLSRGSPPDELEARQGLPPTAGSPPHPAPLVAACSPSPSTRDGASPPAGPTANSTSGLEPRRVAELRRLCGPSWRLSATWSWFGSTATSAMGSPNATSD